MSLVKQLLFLNGCLKEDWNWLSFADPPCQETKCQAHTHAGPRVRPTDLFHNIRSQKEVKEPQ